MIVYRDRALNIIKSKNIPRLWLIFGADEGEVKVFTQKIIDKVKSDEYEVTKLSSDTDIKRAFLERSLFESNKLVLLEGASDSSVKSIEEAIEVRAEEDYLIVCAEELKKTSKLRKLFEDNDDAIVLNCYKLDQHAIASYIESELKERDIKFDKAMPLMMASLISSNIKIIQNELEKITLFLSDSLDKKLTSEVLLEVLSVSPEASLDSLFISIVLNKKKAFTEELQKLSQMNDIFIIRAYQNFLMRVIGVQNQLGKIGIENAMNTLKPPLFGKQRSDFIEVVQKSDVKENTKLLKGALQIECDLKTSSATETLLFQKIIEQLWNT